MYIYILLIVIGIIAVLIYRKTRSGPPTSYAENGESARGVREDFEMSAVKKV